MRYLLDTNVISDYVRGDQTVEQHFVTQRKADLATSSITCMEIEQGFLLSPRSREHYEHLTQALLKDIHVLNFDQEVAITAARLRVQMRQNHPRTGSATPAGNEDLYIAAFALTYDLILVTHNISDFQYFAEIQLQDWRLP